MGACKRHPSYLVMAKSIVDSNRRSRGRSKPTVTVPGLEVGLSNRGFMENVECPQILPPKNFLVLLIAHRGSDIIHLRKI